MITFINYPFKSVFDKGEKEHIKYLNKRVAKIVPILDIICITSITLNFWFVFIRYILLT